jgi:hypothetical protein
MRLAYRTGLLGRLCGHIFHILKSLAQRQQQGDENDEPGGESCTLAVRSGRVR